MSEFERGYLIKQRVFTLVPELGHLLPGLGDRITHVLFPFDGKNISGRELGTFLLFALIIKECFNSQKHMSSIIFQRSLPQE